jgi:hypothetical protein
MIGLIGESMGRLKKDTPSVTVSLRIEAKNKYLAEIASRRAGMSLNRLIETMLEEYVLRTPSGAYKDEILWDENLFRRFVLIAQHSPELLSIEDDFRWKQIQADRSLFKGRQLDWQAVEAKWDQLTVASQAAKNAMVNDFLSKIKLRNISQ